MVPPDELQWEGTPVTESDPPSETPPPWPHDDVLHAWWVKPHRLLAGEYPGATTPEKAAAKVRLLVEAGVDTIVDLTTEHDGLTPYRDELQAAAEHAGRRVRHCAHPIPDFGVLDHAGYDAILARIHSELDAGRTVYVHCWGGKGRTGTVIGCFLAESGLSYDDVIARIAELRSGTRKAAHCCPESAAQHDLLRARCTAGH
ncbi:Protein tyrosine/serine phosphatase [Mycolicibacterium mageritense DSM 44476 = CIP 104973]|nr:Protein tyrosine/serine phosphatase [Mycolicibacterium mageritense DSM 44476 = CIP 104973]